MGTVLFRGKRKDNREWVEGYYAKAKHYATDEEIHVIFPVDVTLYPHSEFSGYEEIIPETLCRLVNDPCYTDYTDQKYFQGDIIELNDRKWGTRVYGVDRKCFGVVVDEHCFTENGLGRRFPQDTLQAKVIGNVFDNPELVGSKYADLYKFYHGYRTEDANEPNFQA